MRGLTPTRYLGSALVLIAALGAANAAGAAETGDLPFFSSLPKSEFVFEAALALDMLTTADIGNQRKPDGSWRLEEQNGILGPHPSPAKIAAYGAAVAALHAAVTYELVSQDVPKPVIMAWEYLTIGIEAGYVGHNYSIGLRCKF